jgi:hypothetical protein
LSPWKELLTIEDFRQAQRSGGYVVITDLATPNKVHSLSCSSVKEGFFNLDGTIGTFNYLSIFLPNWIRIF